MESECFHVKKHNEGSWERSKRAKTSSKIFVGAYVARVASDGRSELFQFDPVDSQSSDLTVSCICQDRTRKSVPVHRMVYEQRRIASLCDGLDVCPPPHALPEDTVMSSTTATAHPHSASKAAKQHSSSVDSESKDKDKDGDKNEH